MQERIVVTDPKQEVEFQIGGQVIRMNIEFGFIKIRGVEPWAAPLIVIGEASNSIRITSKDIRC